MSLYIENGASRGVVPGGYRVTRDTGAHPLAGASPCSEEGPVCSAGVAPPSGLWVPFSHDLASARIRHGPSQ